MKLIVQIPCFNEEETLATAVKAIPRQIDGVDQVEILVIDDGSRDRTFEVATELGVEHIVRHKTNKGLARAFRTGLSACLERGADIVVNTDADNQYDASYIPALLDPILKGEADIVVGDRQTHKIAHFSFFKKCLQKLGSFVVRMLSGLDAPDAVSGFRALSRDAAMDLNVVSTFSYTIEMLIQAGSKRMAVASVPVETNFVQRKSRLFKSIPHFVSRSAATILRMYAMYKPLTVFSTIGIGLCVVGVLPIARFLYFWSTGDSTGHIQSLTLGGSLVVIGFITLLIGVIADLINFNRRLLEIALEKIRRIEQSLAAAEPGAHTRREEVWRGSEDAISSNLVHRLAERLGVELEEEAEASTEERSASSG